MADFETAMAETGFGKFNMLILLVMLPSSMTLVFEVLSMSFVMPVAECDLDLTLERKSLLNSITFAGLICGDLIFGCLGDIFGRRAVMVLCFLLNALLVMVSGFQRDYYALTVLKFLSGFIVDGAVISYYSFLTEYHPAKLRGKIFMVHGILMCVGGVCLPLLAWVTLPKGSWNIFLLLSSTAPWLAALGHFFLPQNPKFLMMSGKNETALKTLRKMYSCNTGKASESYPITSLVEETRASPSKVKALFYPPHIYNLLLMSAVIFAFLFSLNSLRMWLPQIFRSMEDFEREFPGNARISEVLIDMRSNAKEICKSQKHKGIAAYLNTFVVSFSSLLGYVVAVILLDSVIGRKTMIVLCGSLSAVCELLICFTTNKTQVVVLSSMFVALCGVSTAVVIGLASGTFQTSVRTVAIGLVMVFGRLGTITGNMLLPVMLRGGCFTVFTVLSCMVLAGSALAILLPKPAKELV